MTPDLRNLISSLNPESNKLEITVKRFSNTASSRARGYYYGVVIPAIQEQLEDNNGEVLTKGEVDLINRQHAFGGEFTTKMIGEHEVIMFKEISLANISKEKFTAFMEKVRDYWSTRDIQIPEAKNETISKIKSALS